jgi:hypothetical protein
MRKSPASSTVVPFSRDDTEKLVEAALRKVVETVG